MYLKIGLQVFSAVLANDNKALESLLIRDTSDYDLFELRDSQGFTPLSLAAYKNQDMSFTLLFKHA